MAVIAVLLTSGAAMARTITVDLEQADVKAYTPENADLGAYYVFNLAIPAKLPSETFMDAFLEIYVDAESRVDAIAGGGLTTLEVFPLKSALSGELDSSHLRPAAMKRTVWVGESRRVKIDIREHIRNVLDTPAQNFGLVVGSLTGQRLGKFVLKQGVLGQGIVARVTIIYHELEMPAAVPK